MFLLLKGRKENRDIGCVEWGEGRSSSPCHTIHFLISIFILLNSRNFIWSFLLLNRLDSLLLLVHIFKLPSWSNILNTYFMCYIWSFKLTVTACCLCWFPHSISFECLWFLMSYSFSFEPYLWYFFEPDLKESSSKDYFDLFLPVTGGTLLK